jgi:hypothetical protein
LEVNFFAAFLSRRLCAKDLEDMAILIDRPSEIVPLTMNREKDLIQMPLITPSTATAPKMVGISLAVLLAPLTDRLIRRDVPTGEQRFFDITITETETEVEPGVLANHFGRETVVLVAVGGYRCVRTTSISHLTAAQQVDSAVVD